MGYFFDISFWAITVSVLIGAGVFQKSAAQFMHFTLNGIFTPQVMHETEAAFQSLAQFTQEEEKQFAQGLVVRKDLVDSVLFEIPLQNIQPQSLQFRLTEKAIEVRAQNFQNQELEHSLELPPQINLAQTQMKQLADRLIVRVPRQGF